jgi:hypothetical protein
MRVPAALIAAAAVKDAFVMQSPAEDIKKSASWTVLRNAYLLLQVRSQLEERRKREQRKGRESNAAESCRGHQEVCLVDGLAECLLAPSGANAAGRNHSANAAGKITKGEGGREAGNEVSVTTDRNLCR